MGFGRFFRRSGIPGKFRGIPLCVFFVPYWAALGTSCPRGRLWRGPLSSIGIIRSLWYFGLGRAGVGGYAGAPSLVLVLLDLYGILA